MLSSILSRGRTKNQSRRIVGRFDADDTVNYEANSRLTTETFSAADNRTVSDRGAFRPIACLAEQLDIPFRIAAAFRQGDDVVVFKSFHTVTTNAPTLIASPYENANIRGNRFSRNAPSLTEPVKPLDIVSHVSKCLFVCEHEVLHGDKHFIQT